MHKNYGLSMGLVYTVKKNEIQLSHFFINVYTKPIFFDHQSIKFIFGSTCKKINNHVTLSISHTLCMNAHKIHQYIKKHISYNKITLCIHTCINKVNKT